MPTQYIVIERSYIYNDETYDRSEGGEPRKLFDTLEEAQKYARQLNLETFESHSHLYEVHETIAIGKRRRSYRKSIGARPSRNGNARRRCLRRLVPNCSKNHLRSKVH